MCSSQFRDAGREREIKKIETAVDVACQRNLSAYHFGHACHKLDSPDVGARKYMSLPPDG